jgi:glycosyltransferase involved in cell wall biosynthesis
LKKLRIVILLIEPPLPFGNAAARWYYVLLKGLVERGHEVSAIATYSKESEIKKVQELFPSSSYDLKLFPMRSSSSLPQKIESFLRPYSFKISSEVQEALDIELKKGFDILHVEQLWASWAALDYQNKTLLSIHYYQNIDLEFSLNKSLKERFQKWQIFRTEEKLTRHFPYIKTCSKRLEDLSRKMNPKAQVQTIPFGMESSLYEYIKDEDRGQEPTIVMIGTMSWYPTSSAAIRLLEKLWPSIKAQVPKAKLKIIGYDARSVLKDYLEVDGVEIIENVPNIEPYFKMGSVFVYAPGRGSGMKIKILEAMLFGIPVVTTSEGAEGFPAIDGVHAGICEDDKGLIDRSVALLNDIEKQNQQRLKGRELVESFCSPKATLDQLEKVYQKMIDPS